VVEIYHKRAGGWYRCVFWYGGKLEEGLSPYQDERGRPCCPILAQSCYIDRENRRYGIVRDMRGPQDEINKRRSKLLHLINTRQAQAQGDEWAEQDVENVRREVARPDGVIPRGWGVVSTADMASGQASLLAEAKAEIERMGPSPAVLAQQSASASGRAQAIRQSAGMTETAPIFAGLEALEMRVYRAMWARIKQFWRGPEWVRVTDDENAASFIGINQPIYGDPQPMLQPDGTVAVGQPVLGYQNAVAEMNVDIEIDSTPDTATLAQEQFLGLIDLARSGVAIPPSILIEASQLPNKRQLLEKMEAMAAQPNPAAQMAQAQGEAQVLKTRSEAALNAAKAEGEAVRNAPPPSLQELVASGAIPLA
jgi:hypothetical protein